jgi:hypothetical protein
MGKLAERLSDPQRSGVYRVESTEALEEATALNGFALARFVLEDPARLSVRSIVPERDGAVLLFSGFEERLRAAPRALHPLLEELEGATAGCRQNGQRFFAAFLDPLRVIPSLAPLYNWNRR